MFELETAINQWRRQIESAWRRDAAAMAELEDHLREEFAALVHAGHAEEDAWRLATVKFGDPTAIAGELAKVHRLSTADRAVLVVMVGAALSVIGVLGWVLRGVDSSLTSQPLLASHVVTITLGYVAGLLAAVAAAYAIMRTLVRPASTAALQHATLAVVRSASVAASGLSLVGFVLGAVWAQDEWGRAFSADPKEIGALFVIIAFASLAIVAWRRPASTRMPLAIAACGGGLVLAAWFGAASMTADGAALLQAIGFGGLALSLGLAALALAIIDRRCDAPLERRAPLP
jgi:hypothetical protein